MADAPLLDDVIQTVHRLLLLQTLCATPFTATKSPGKLLRKGLVLAELCEYWLVCEVRNVLGIVERCRRR